MFILYFTVWQKDGAVDWIAGFICAKNLIIEAFTLNEFSAPLCMRAFVLVSYMLRSILLCMYKIYIIAHNARWGATTFVVFAVNIQTHAIQFIRSILSMSTHKHIHTLYEKKAACLGFAAIAKVILLYAFFSRLNQKTWVNFGMQFFHPSRWFLMVNERILRRNKHTWLYSLSESLYVKYSVFQKHSLLVNVILVKFRAFFLNFFFQCNSICEFGSCNVDLSGRFSYYTNGH